MRHPLAPLYTALQLKGVFSMDAFRRSFLCGRLAASPVVSLRPFWALAECTGYGAYVAVCPAQSISMHTIRHQGAMA